MIFGLVSSQLQKKLSCTRFNKTFKIKFSVNYFKIKRIRDVYHNAALDKKKTKIAYSKKIDIVAKFLVFYLKGL